MDAEGNIWLGTGGAGRRRSSPQNFNIRNRECFCWTDLDWRFGIYGWSRYNFNNPIGLAIDSQGNFYVADDNNKRIRKITPAGFVSTLAGTGIQGFKDGQGDSAQFYQLHGVAVAAQGNVYVTNWHCIRKITPGGVVSLLAGTYMPGYADGPAAAALFKSPVGLAFDATGSLFVADASNTRIRKITFELSIAFPTQTLAPVLFS